MKRYWWLIHLPMVLLLLDGTEVPRQAAAQSRDREIVTYVADSSNPSYLVVSGGIAVALNHRTQYWIQAPRGDRRRKGTMNDLLIEHRVRILVGPDNVAKSVTVFKVK